MARARNIKPGFFKNELLVELSFETRLLFIGLWTLADREGRLEDRPKKIKMEIFPADDISVDESLSSLDRVNLILRYEVDGKRFINIENFAKHQHPHHMEVASVIPAPPINNESSARDQVVDESLTNRSQPDIPRANPSESLLLIPDSPLLIPDTGKNLSARGTRLEKDWTPSDEQFEFCLHERPDLKAAEVADRFRDYWVAVPGAKGRKLDWDATWRNWVRNTSKGAANQSQRDKTREWADKLTGKDRENGKDPIDGDFVLAD